MNQLATQELKLFIAEAERLSTRSFYQHFITEGEICFSDGSVPENIHTIEQLESYLLHFRKFIQKNDRVCVQRINQYVHDLATGQNVFLNNWNELYATFQEFLNAKALTGRTIFYIPNLPELSLLDLFKVRTFGDLSHLDARKQVLHQQLSATSQLDGLYRFEYYSFLSEAGEIIIEMAALCTELISLA